MKRNVKQSIHTKKKMRSWKKGVAAASILVGVSVAMLGIGFPTYAGGLPIVGDIFRFLDNGRTGLYENYKEFSTELNMTRESNGVKVTINDAVFDGRTITITYSIESDKDLGEKPNIFGYPQVMGFNGGGGSSQVTKVGEKKYVGMTTMSSNSSKRLDVANVWWNMEEIELDYKGNSIKGNWNFALSLKAMESKEVKVNGVSENELIKVNIDKMEVTPMSFIVFFNQEESKVLRSIWDSADVELEIKDDLGNKYAGEGNGGTSTVAEPHKSSWSATFQKLNKNATKLIVTPQVNLRVHTSENFGGVEFINGIEKKIEVPNKEAKKKDIVLDDIVIDLKK
ncbi:ECF-type sigma factor negative effector [Bacillus thuringiensis serovar pondicheriensis BGSC 4BA1]|nr:ECF-type sigma factor negative effector [Bacillus thuringiensis serovar pondicheriensis BGSC 4BA1]